MTMPFQVALAMTFPDRIFVPALPKPRQGPGKTTDETLQGFAARQSSIIEFA
jgi:hypothetical protein